MSQPNLQLAGGGSAHGASNYSGAAAAAALMQRGGHLPAGGSPPKWVTLFVLPAWSFTACQICYLQCCARPRIRLLIYPPPPLCPSPTPSAAWETACCSWASAAAGGTPWQATNTLAWP